MPFPKYILLAGLALMAACAGTGVTADRLSGLEKRWIASAYFDRGMGYENSRLQVVSFAEVLDRFDREGGTDAVLLNCFDDYQGIVSVADVRRYDLQLATRIELAPGSDRPGWLNPLLIVVPDGASAPFVERFMTANIRELRLVRLADYYAPLETVTFDSRTPGGSKGAAGLKIFKDNCLFCHAVRGVGGNKGGSLLKAFDFSSESERERFRDTFFLVHRQDNPDKQNLEKFMTGDRVMAVAEFLRQAE